ncbi:serine/arginine repetitive matrix protein 1-like [Littorina saxatilis]|uniref:Uncharacterized protein n=1 Tax=Littorina saxatilis TaxID=31220 RepID=A0AAN9GJM7_9CAEN
MAHDQVGVSLFEKLNQTAFLDPATLPESPTERAARPQQPSSAPSGKPDARQSIYFGVHVPPACRRVSEMHGPSQPRSNTLRRLTQQLRSGLISGTIDLKKLSMLSATVRKSSDSQGEEEDVRERRSSSLERDGSGKLQPVYSLAVAVSSDSGSDSDDSGVFTRQAPSLVRARSSVIKSKPPALPKPPVLTQTTPRRAPSTPTSSKVAVTSTRTLARTVDSVRLASPLNRNSHLSSQRKLSTERQSLRAMTPSACTVATQRKQSAERRHGTPRRTLPSVHAERATRSPRPQSAVRKASTPGAETQLTAAAASRVGERRVPRGVSSGRSQSPAPATKMPSERRGADRTSLTAKNRPLTPYPRTVRKAKTDEDPAEPNAQTTRPSERRHQQGSDQLMEKVTQQWTQLLAQHRQKMDKTQDLFAEKQAAIRATHLQDRLQLSSVTSEQSQVLVKQLVLSERFATMSDDDFNLAIKQLSSQLSDQHDAAVSILEDAHLRDWEDFMHERETYLTQLQQSLEMKRARH